MPGTVQRKITVVSVTKTTKRRRGVDSEGLASNCAEAGADAQSAVVGEADQPLVECGVPQSGEQEPIVDIEALRIVAVSAKHAEARGR
jgi:hypothetical protein